MAVSYFFVLIVFARIIHPTFLNKNLAKYINILQKYFRSGQKVYFINRGKLEGPHDFNINMLVKK